MSLRTLMPAALAALLLAAAPARAQAAADASADLLQAEHVVILLDASGSMTTEMGGDPSSTTPTRMDAAKAAISKVIDGLDAGVRIGLLAFTAAGETDWYYPIGPLDKAKFREGLAAIEADGGTPLGEYIEKAANALLSQRQEHEGYGDYRLIVVTDGEAEDPERMDAAASQLLSRGISLDVVGVQMAATHALSARAHSYRDAGDQASLEKAIRAILAETGGSASQDGDAETFALANAFGDSAALAVLKTLGTGLSNAPIGAAASVAGPEAIGSPTRSVSGGGSPGGGGGGPPKWLYLLIALVVFAWLRGLRRGRRR